VIALGMYGLVALAEYRLLRWRQYGTAVRIGQKREE